MAAQAPPTPARREAGKMNRLLWEALEIATIVAAQKAAEALADELERRRKRRKD